MPGVAHIAVASGILLLAYLIPMAAGAFLDIIRDGEASRIEASLSKQARKYDDLMRENATKAQSRWNSREDKIEAENDEYEKQIDGLFESLNERMERDPFGVDDALARSLFIVMCEIEADGNPAANEACRVRASKADTTRYSPVFSITAERIEDWRVLCEQTGEDAYCKPNTISFTPAAAEDLVRYLGSVRATLAKHGARGDTLTGQIEQLQNLPEPEIIN